MQAYNLTKPAGELYYTVAALLGSNTVQMSESIRSKIAALSRDFTRQLPQRFKEMEQSLKSLRQEANMEQLHSFRLMLHKLAGSAATFGNGSLSERAREFEIYIDSLISSAKGPHEIEWETLESYLRYVRGAGTEMGEGEAALEEIAEEEDGAAVFGTQLYIEQELKDQEREKKVLLYGFPSGLEEEVTRQVGFYGYTTAALTSLQGLSDLLQQGKSRIAFVHMELLDEHPETERELGLLKREYPELLNIFYISAGDSFDLRLRAIRAGGDAFMVLPLDIGWLIDKLDSFSRSSQRDPYHILIVDDDQEQVAYYALLLQQAGMITSVASDPLKVLSILVESKPDMILMDMYMPNCSGIELARMLRQHEAFVTLPITFLSYEKDPQLQMEAVRNGGDDFLTKPVDPQYLVSLVRVRVERTRNMRYFMERDSLTGLLNHSNLKDQLGREIIRARRMGTSLSFAMIDTDRFKRINDTFGHLTGDRVLKSLARLLQDRVRRTDIVGRYGGEEFGVILLNADAESARKIMDEIRINFAQIRHRADDREFYISFSCGIAEYPGYEDAEELSCAADEAMYAAKQAGRNRVMLAGPSSGEGQ
jgi:diguanylate cyclase (GGDEF)-like protein